MNTPDTVNPIATRMRTRTGFVGELGACAAPHAGRIGARVVVPLPHAGHATRLMLVPGAPPTSGAANLATTRRAYRATRDHGAP